MSRLLPPPPSPLHPFNPTKPIWFCVPLTDRHVTGMADRSQNTIDSVPQPINSHRDLHAASWTTISKSNNELDQSQVGHVWTDVVETSFRGWDWIESGWDWTQKKIPQKIPKWIKKERNANQRFGTFAVFSFAGCASVRSGTARLPHFFPALRTV